MFTYSRLQIVSFFIPVFVDTHLLWNPKLSAHKMEKAFTTLITMIFCVWETLHITLELLVGFKIGDKTHSILKIATKAWGQIDPQQLWRLEKVGPNYGQFQTHSQSR